MTSLLVSHAHAQVDVGILPPGRWRVERWPLVSNRKHVGSPINARSVELRRCEA